MNRPGVENSGYGQKMVRVTVEIRERTVVRRVRITAGSLERALSMAGEGNPEREVSLFVPTDGERFSTRATRGTPEGISPGAAFAEAA